MAVPHPGANVRPEEKIPVDLLPIAIQILAATVHKQVPTVRVVVATVVVIQRPVGGAGFRSGKARTHTHTHTHTHTERTRREGLRTRREDTAKLEWWEMRWQVACALIVDQEVALNSAWLWHVGRRSFRDPAQRQVRRPIPTVQWAVI